MKKKAIISLITLIVLSGILLGFVFLRSNRNKGIKYKKEPIQRGDIEALVVTTGTLNPVTIVEVGSQVSGRIAKLYADFNSKVKKGEIIAELDQSLFLTRLQQNEANFASAKASLEKAKVTFENAQKRYERALSLFEKKFISYEEKEAAETQYFAAKADLQSAEAHLEQAKSQLDASKVDLTYTVIRSPIDGIVISRNVNVGQTVAASFQAPVLFKIANDLSKMQVECSVDEADIGKVKEGQKVRFTVDAFPEETFTGTILQVRYSPETIQNVVTYTTIAEVDNPQLKLRPGMTATVSIITGEARNVLKVPNAALRFTPQLSPEEMAGIMEEMRKRFSERRMDKGQTLVNSPESRTDQRRERVENFRESPSFFFKEESLERSAMRRQFSRVWIESESGKLMPVFIKTGVTDNTFTEIIQGDLKEGQLVITGLESEEVLQSAPTPGPRGGMFLIRR